MRGRVHARRMLKGLIADLRLYKETLDKTTSTSEHGRTELKTYLKLENNTNITTETTTIITETTTKTITDTTETILKIISNNP